MNETPHENRPMGSPTPRARPVVLVVLDGAVPLRGIDDDAWLRRIGGHSEREPAYPRGRITADGPEVGAFSSNAVLRSTISRAKELGGRLHLIGLLSAGGVHSSLDHLHALIDLARGARVRVVVHALLDGRDVPSGTAPKYVADLERTLGPGVGRIGTVGGRFWGMDRENRWERTAKSYRAILAADVHRADSALRGIEDSYASGLTDDLVQPFVVFDYPGVSPVDAAIHFNYRPDGVRQLARSLADSRFDGFVRKGGRAPFAGRLACLTDPDGTSALPAAFVRTTPSSALAALLARAGHRHVRCGGAEQARDAILGRQHEVVLVDLAMPPPGAGGGAALAVSDAARGAAVEAVEAAVARIVDATRSVGGAMILTASHCAAVASRTGATVPLIYVHDADRDVKIRPEGSLCDVAPTLLELLGLPQPLEMTGRSLLDRS